jgi:hypothetical protein
MQQHLEKKVKAVEETMTKDGQTFIKTTDVALQYETIRRVTKKNEPHSFFLDKQLVVCLFSDHAVAFVLDHSSVVSWTPTVCSCTVVSTLSKKKDGSRSGSKLRIDANGAAGPERGDRLTEPGQWRCKPGPASLPRRKTWPAAAARLMPSSSRWKLVVWSCDC